MSILAHVVMLIWVPAVLLLFAVLPPRCAVVTAFLGGFLFLPIASYKLTMLPDYTKMSATCAGILLGAFVFDSARILKFRPRLIDLPIAIFCLSPLASSLANDLGLWDGASSVLTNTVTWGFPYLIGRVYFTDTKSLKELAVGIFIGGLIYIPFCLFEMRMSPQLHNMVYGFHARGVQSRFGGWRPAVFLDGGLQLGLWMSVASMMGLWLWWTGRMKRLFGIPMVWLVWPLLITTVLCRASGALALEMMALGAIWVSRVTGTRVALWGLLLLAPAYLVLRTTGLWEGELITSLAEKVDPARAQSFDFRIKNEDILVAKALQRPIFGWGGWGRSRIYDDWGKDISITDGMWVIELGTHGLIGLISVYCVLLLPLFMLLRNFPTKRILSRECASAALLAIAATLFALDCLPNAMIHPVYISAAGAVTSFAVAKNAVGGAAVKRIARGEMAQSVPERRLHPYA